MYGSQLFYFSFYLYASMKKIVSIFLLAYASTLIATGKILLLVVLSGSMNPIMKVGDLIIVERCNDFKVGDIISFKDPSGRRNVLITHRLIDIKNGRFITKGDANEEADDINLTRKDIVGKAVFSIPYLGYVLKSRNPILYFTFILAPSLYLIGMELRDITDIRRRMKDLRKEIKAKRYRRTIKIRRLLATYFALTALFVFLTTPIIIDGKNAGFFECTAIREGIPNYDVIAVGENVGSAKYVVQLLPPFWVTAIYSINPALLRFIPWLLAILPTFAFYPLWTDVFPSRRRAL